MGAGFCMCINPRSGCSCGAAPKKAAPQSEKSRRMKALEDRLARLERAQRVSGMMTRLIN